MTLTRLAAIRQRGTMHSPNVRRKTASMQKAGIRALVPGLLADGMEMPDIIEFVCSDKFLFRGQTLYPRQATFLKVATLQKELLCADEQTEILTRRGWVTYDALRQGEDVMTLTQEGLGEWAPAERINIYPVKDEPLILMQGEAHSSLTTPNHRWLVERLCQDGGRTRYERQFVETRDLLKRDRIACAAPTTNLPTEKVWDDGFVELVAWYWTEGHAIVGSSGGVTISQSKKVNPAYVDRIRQCLTDVYGPASDHLWGSQVPAWREDLDPTDNKDVVRFRLNVLAGRDLQAIAPGKEKVVDPDFLSSLTQEQLDLYIETSIAADGWTVDSGGTRTITQASLARLDSFQMACSLAGIRSTARPRPIRSGVYAGREAWSLSLLGKRPYFSPQPRTASSSRRVGFSITEVEHTGVVWCPTTKNGTWLARRNGTVYFTGNTEYDYDVLGQWADGFRLPEPGEYTVEDEDDKFGFVPTGALAHGIQPDWERRMDLCLAEGRPWFREVQAVLGRRASKGFMGGLLAARVFWHFLLKGNPQGFYGVDESKRLLGIVFAGKRSQAKENQWKDIVNVMLGAPCFQPYISRPLAESLTIFAPHDAVREEAQIQAGIISEADLATFEIVPRESTVMAGRGPTSLFQAYDEMAHVVATGMNRSAEEVYEAATPALDQFGTDGFIYVGSSPWQMTGKLYENYQLSLGADPLTREPLRPEMLMLQLPSWALYEDWQYAHNLPMRPGEKSSALGARGPVQGADPKVQVSFGPNFPKIKRAIQTYDEQMRRLERANPDTFKVERLAQWASSMHGYLDESKIAAMWEEWPPGSGRKLEQQASGKLSIDYIAHGDPSKVNDSFGWVMAHREGPDINGLYHVVVDQVHAWHPSDYKDHTIDYIEVEKDIIERAKAFQPSMLTFDQFSSVSMIQRIRRELDRFGGPKRTQVEEVTSTAKLNWKMAETLKAALNMGLVHSPHFELLELELRFLQLKAGKVDHPSSGPVQSKDVADALIHCVSHLIGEQMGAYLKGDLASLSPSGSRPTSSPDTAIFGALSGAGAARMNSASRDGLRGHVGR